MLFTFFQGLKMLMQEHLWYRQFPAHFRDSNTNYFEH